MHIRAPSRHAGVSPAQIRSKKAPSLTSPVDSAGKREEIAMMSTLVCFLIIVLILPFRTEQFEESSSSSSSSRYSATRSSSSRSSSTSDRRGVERTQPAPSTDTPTTEVPPTLTPFCASLFVLIGPFCTIAVEDDGVCSLDFRASTCDICRNLTATCGFYSGDICSSSLSSRCPAEPGSDIFLTDFCSAVVRNCPVSGLPFGPQPPKGALLLMAAPQRAAGGGSGDGATTLPSPTTPPVSCLKPCNVADAGHCHTLF